MQCARKGTPWAEYAHFAVGHERYHVGIPMGIGERRRARRLMLADLCVAFCIEPAQCKIHRGLKPVRALRSVCTPDQEQGKNTHSTEK